MSTETKLLLKRSARLERWESRERGDYNLDRLGEEFRTRLYSQHGREVLAANASRETRRGVDQDK